MSQGTELDVPDDPGFNAFMWYIYRKNMFTDVEFELQTREGPITFSAHRIILAMWSPEFEDRFYRGEKQNLVCLKDVNPKAFQDMLSFMYGCEPELDSLKDACELSKVATEFKVAGAVSLCEKFLLNGEVKVTNVFDILEMAERMQNDSLTNRCLELIQTETHGIFEYYSCSDFTPAMIRIILKSPKLALDSEVDLLHWLFAWAKNRSLEHHAHSSLRDALEDFLPLLDFLALSDFEFATICGLHEDFFSEGEALKIFMNIGQRDSRPMPAWHDASAQRRVYTGKH